MEQTKTKKALIMSVLSMVLCIAMLIGMTFAWFTDTASTGVNKIQAGNLKVQLLDERNNVIGKDTKLTWKKAVTGEEVLWEPNCKYELQNFKVKNAGNLALKYKVILDATDISKTADGKTLLDVIDWTIKIDGTEVSTVTSDQIKNGLKDGIAIIENKSLAKEATSGLISVTGHMSAAAGNEYQGLSIDGFGITVVATQDTVENDSIDNKYDENATYPVSSVAGMKTALTNGGIVEVAGDLDTGKETLKVTNNTTINMNGKEITNTADIWKDASGSDGNWSLISARSGAKLTISGNGTFKAKANDAMAVDVQGDATLTIKNGTFIGNVDAVYVFFGTAIIEGGFFDIQQKADGNTIKAQYRFLLNCYDANYRNGTAKIIVKGGTFVNFDPSDNPEGAATTFVADGYKVVSEAHGSDTWYKVVKA